MAERSEITRAENSLRDWVNAKLKQGFTRAQIERILVEELHRLIKDRCVSQKNIPENNNFVKCCEYLKRNFDINVSVSDIKKHVKNDHILSDIVSGAYRNTHVIEEIADILSNAIVGMCMPCYGESKSIIAKFQKVAKEKGFID